VLTDLRKQPQLARKLRKVLKKPIDTETTTLTNEIFSNYCTRIYHEATILYNILQAKTQPFFIEDLFIEQSKFFSIKIRIRNNIKKILKLF